VRGVPGSSSQLERLRLLPDIGSRRSRRSARDPMIQRVSSSCTHVISRISKTVGRFPKRLGGSPRNAGTDRTVQMWHVWHDVGKKGSRARALGRRYFVLIWPRRCVVAWVAREREARFAKFRAGVLGSRVVVQARRTWWLAAPRGFSPTARRANPQTASKLLKRPVSQTQHRRFSALPRTQAESGKRQPVSGRNEAKSVWT